GHSAPWMALSSLHGRTCGGSRPWGAAAPPASKEHRRYSGSYTGGAPPAHRLREQVSIRLLRLRPGPSPPAEPQTTVVSTTYPTQLTPFATRNTAVTARSQR